MLNMLDYGEIYMYLMYKWMLNLATSNSIAFSGRMICSLALQVAFIAGGCMHSRYNKILKQHLGMPAVNAKLSSCYILL